MRMFSMLHTLNAARAMLKKKTKKLFKHVFTKATVM